ncbi:MAG: hypothetical protein AAB267_07965 [Candidatus Desantisbacteria bacterium]
MNPVESRICSTEEKKKKDAEMYKYAIEIFYSREDEGYIAVVPELPGCSAFGEKY